MEEFLSILFSVAKAFIAYGFPQLLFLILRHSPLTLKKLRTVCILLSSLVFALFETAYLISETVNLSFVNVLYSAVFGYVYYLILKKSFYRRNLLRGEIVRKDNPHSKQISISADVPDVPSSDAPSSDVPSSDVPSSDVPSSDVPSSSALPKMKRYCKYCGCEIDSVTKKCISCGHQYFKPLHFSTSTIILCILLVLSLAGNILLYSTVYKSEQQLTDLNATISDLEASVEQKKSVITARETEIRRLRRIVNQAGRSSTVESILEKYNLS